MSALVDRARYTTPAWVLLRQIYELDVRPTELREHLRRL